MPSVSQIRRRKIASTPDAIWLRITDAANWSKWHPAFEFVDAPSQLGVGSEFSFKNGKTHIHATVTSLDPPKEFAFVGTAWGVTAKNRWILSAVTSNETDVSVSEEMHGLLPYIFSRRFNTLLGQGLESWISSLAQAVSTPSET